MARTLNEQLLHEAGLAEPEPAAKKPDAGLVRRILRLVFYARLGVWLLALVVAITFMVFPWPGTVRTAVYDLVVLAALIWLGLRWRRYRTARKNSSQTDTHQGDRWTSTS